MSAVQERTTGGHARPSANAEAVIAKRWSRKRVAEDGSEVPTETWPEITSRVVAHVAKAEPSEVEREAFVEALTEMMLARRFMPNTPCLVNAGKAKAQLAACYVLPVEDDLDSINDHVKFAGKIHQSGGGCIAEGSRVWTSFCGIEPIDVLFARVTADGRAGVRHGAGTAFDVTDLDIRTVSMDPRTGEIGEKPVTHVWKFDVPFSDQVEVRTREGVSLQTSRWHPFLAVRGTELVEVRSDELREGDVILGPGRPDSFWSAGDPRQHYAFGVLDPGIAWLAAYALGDGTFTYVKSQRLLRLRLFSGTPDTLERAREIVKQRCPGYRAGVVQERETLFVLSVTNRIFVETMLVLCGLLGPGRKAHKIRIPEVFGKADLNQMRAFLAGLIDSDGYVAPDGSPSYSTISEAMAQDVAALCSLLGFRPTVRRKAPRGKGKRPVYEVQLCVLSQVAQLYRDLEPYLANEFRRDRLKAAATKEPRVRLAIDPWRELLRRYDLARDRGGRHGAGAFSEALNRWSCDANGRCRRRDLEDMGRALESLGVPAGGLLRRVAESGLEITSVSAARAKRRFYDLTVAEWNTYAAGNDGLAMIHNTGQTYEKLRPAGSRVSGGGTASGPVSFMKLLNVQTEVVKQGGVRRGANMGILACWHPDVLRFVHAKNDQTSLTNFNISVSVTDEFLSAVREGRWFQTEFPKGTPYERDVFDPAADGGKGGPYTYRGERPPKPGMIYAPEVWERIVVSNHTWGEPGIVFIDEINRTNPLVNTLGPKAATNPCVTGDTLVATDLGMLPISELAEAGKAPWVTLDRRFGVEALLAPALRVWKTGRKPVLRLETREGFSLRATPDHRVMTTDGWVELGSLRPGQRVHVLNSGSVGGLFGDASLGREVALAVKRHTEVALRVGDAGADPCAFERVYEAALASGASERAAQRLASHAEACDYAGLAGGLLAASSECQAAFLKEYLSARADCAYVPETEPGWGLVISDESRDFLRAIQLMLLGQRVFSELRGTPGVCAPELVIAGRHLIFLHDTLGIDDAWLSRKVGIDAAELAASPTPDFTATVTAIVEDGVEDVYDLTEPLTHSFCAGGIVVHNCGEQGLHPYNSCNLGSLDLAKYFVPSGRDVSQLMRLDLTIAENPGDEHAGGGEIDWEALGRDVEWAVRFLDNVIDTCAWPLPQIAEVVRRTRPVGLGIMGLADLLILKRLRYGSREAAEYTERVMAFVRRRAWETSLRLGAERGTLPDFAGNEELFEKLVYDTVGIPRSVPLTPRNYECTTVAPTGTISLGADTSSGCEPVFSFAMLRKDTVGERHYAHPLAAAALRIEMDPSDPDSVNRAAREIAERRGELPPHFVDVAGGRLTPEDHLRMLRACQRNVDNSVSKTVNAPADTPLETTRRIFELAVEYRLKAISYYRDGCRDNQVLSDLPKAAPGAGPAADSEPKQMTRPEAPSVSRPVAPESSEPVQLPRPRELAGWSWKISLAAENDLYVNVHHDGGRVLEMFVTGPLSTSVGLLASKMLRSGHSPEAVARSLDHVTGQVAVSFNRRLCTSPEQLAAECLRIASRRLRGLPDSPKDDPSSARSAGPAGTTERRATEASSPRARSCPNCGADEYVPDAGCHVCLACGFSSCS